MSRDFINERYKKILPPIMDFLIPALDDMPSATAAEVDSRWGNQVLSVRHDLREPFFRGLRFIEKQAEKDVETALEELQKCDLEAFDALGTVVAGGYLLNPDIRKKIGYPGQRARIYYEAIDVPDYVSDGLLSPVLERG